MQEKIPIENTFLIGYVGKPKGLNGEFYVNLTTETPENYLDVPFVFLAHKTWKEAVKYPVEYLNIAENGNFIMKLETLDDRDTLGKIKGFSVLLPMEFLPEIQEDDNFYLFEIIGYKVIEKKLGFVGEVHSILEIPANPLAEIRHYEGFIFLLPLTEQFVPRINRKKKEIYAELPEGFIDAYKNV